MDRERLGRVLGRGARLAARTALEAVDAATAAPPQPTGNAVGVPSLAVQRRAPQVLSPVAPAGHPATRTAIPAAARAAAAGALAPLKRASRALWLEVTGSFFALFALSFGMGAWHTRAGLWSSVPADRHRTLAFCALSVLFLYFSISSFLRARRVSSLR